MRNLNQPNLFIKSFLLVLKAEQSITLDSDDSFILSCDLNLNKSYKILVESVSVIIGRRNMCFFSFSAAFLLSSL
jgi:hypothetical protein